MGITIDSLKTKTPNPNYPGVTDIAPSEVLEKTALVQLIDVRQPDEYDGELGHIEEARLIPLGTLPQCIAELPKEDLIVFICRSGNRSAQAASFAIENGITNIVNMSGGMLEWNEAGYKVIK